MLGSAGAPLRAGHLTAGPVLVAIFGFLLMAVLMIRRFPAAILLGILLTRWSPSSLASRQRRMNSSARHPVWRRCSSS